MSWASSPIDSPSSQVPCCSGVPSSASAKLVTTPELRSSTYATPLGLTATAPSRATFSSSGSALAENEVRFWLDLTQN